MEGTDRVVEFLYRAYDCPYFLPTADVRFFEFLLQEYKFGIDREGHTIDELSVPCTGIVEGRLDNSKNIFTTAL